MTSRLVSWQMLGTDKNQEGAKMLFLLDGALDNTVLPPDVAREFSRLHRAVRRDIRSTQLATSAIR